MYKIIYDTVAKMRDGSLGNISQGIYTVYTNCEFEEIKPKLIEYLADTCLRKYVPIIKSTEKIDGHVI